MKLTASMSEALYLPSNWEFFFDRYTFNVMFETHTLYVNVTVNIHCHVLWLTLVKVLEIRSAFGGAVISRSRERQTTASQMLIEFSPKRPYFDSASLIFVALEPAEIMKSLSDSQIRRYKIRS